MSILNTMLKVKSDPSYVHNSFSQRNQKVHTSLIRCFTNFELLRAGDDMSQFANVNEQKGLTSRQPLVKMSEEAHCQASQPKFNPQYPHVGKERNDFYRMSRPPQACWGCTYPTYQPTNQPRQTETHTCPGKHTHVHTHTVKL